jgi:hypothetical protein
MTNKAPCTARGLTSIFYCKTDSATRFHGHESIGLCGCTCKKHEEGCVCNNRREKLVLTTVSKWFYREQGYWLLCSGCCSAAVTSKLSLIQSRACSFHDRYWNVNHPFTGWRHDCTWWVRRQFLVKGLPWSIWKYYGLVYPRLDLINLLPNKQRTSHSEIRWLECRVHATFLCRVP